MNRTASLSARSMSLIAIAVLLASMANVAPVGAGPLAGAPANPEASAPPTAKMDVHMALGNLPLYFVENRGQMDAQVAYYVQGADTALYFTAQGVTFVLTDGRQQRADPSLPPEAASAVPPKMSDQKRWVVKLDFLNTSGVRPEARDQTQAVVSYFKGARDQWQTGLTTYSTLVYQDLWPGIDLVYSGSVNRLKYQFLVHPGADPNQIRLSYRGATAVTLNAAGQMAVSTPAGGFLDDVPQAYQETASGQRAAVGMAYALEGGCSSQARSPEDMRALRMGYRPAALNENRCAYGFQVGHYDPRRVLVLDPAVVVWAGYIGGSGNDYGYDIAVDSAGNAYVTGYTNSYKDFPVIAGPDVTFNGAAGTYDAFVAKVDASGKGLIYAGYIGGSGNDFGYSIALDGKRNAYVTGATTSVDFPCKGQLCKERTSNADAFVAGVDPSGTGLVIAGYIGGDLTDAGMGIAYASPACVCTCPPGYLYVTGYTASDDFPVKGTVLGQKYNGGAYDAFVARINLSTLAIDYAGYIGGTGEDRGRGIAASFGANGEVVFVTGYTSSADFPVTGPEGDKTFNGATDAFVAVLTGGGLASLTYLGGSGDDRGMAIASRCTGSEYKGGPCLGYDVYVAGYTTSTDFPVLAWPWTINKGGTDAFVAGIHWSGLVFFAGYIGGANDDYATDIAVYGANVYVTGYTASDETTFPVHIGPDLTYNGGSNDAFVAKVKPDGGGLLYAGYLGGSGNDLGLGIAADSSGNAYVVGQTSSADFPVFVGPDTTYHDAYDAFVAKVPNGALPLVGFASSAYSVGVGAGQATIFVNLTASSWPTATVHYATSGNTALAPGDYITATGTLTFAPGVTTQWFSVPIVDDPGPEPNEAMTLTLSSPSNAGLGSLSAVALTILNHQAFAVNLPLVYAYWPCGKPAESEPNDGIDQANGPLCSGMSYSGRNDIEGGDDDYFRINVDQPGSIKAQLTARSNDDPQLEIFDAQGGLLTGCGYDGTRLPGGLCWVALGISPNWTVTYNTPVSGTYYVRVYTAISPTTYSLVATFP